MINYFLTKAEQALNNGDLALYEELMSKAIRAEELEVARSNRETNPHALLDSYRAMQSAVRTR